MMKLDQTVKILACLASATVLACGGEDASRLNGGGAPPASGPIDPGAPPAGDPEGPAQCAGRDYVGYDNASLTAGRAAASVGVDRQRIKPFSSLETEYARVLGAAPASLAAAAATFGQPPARWFVEPQANAVALQTAYAVAFDACLSYTATAPELAAAPDATTAAAQCAAMARKFWSKTPSPQEIQACADVAVKGAAAEPQPRRKWAYACASVLTSTGFLTY